MTNSDFVQDFVFFTNIPTQAESLLHSMEIAAGGIGLYMNANKIELMCFKQEGAIFTLSAKPLKLVDQFTYLGCNISSTESDVNMYLAKVWTALDSLSIIWKSDLFDKIKKNNNTKMYILMYNECNS